MSWSLSLFIILLSWVVNRQVKTWPKRMVVSFLYLCLNLWNPAKLVMSLWCCKQKYKKKIKITIKKIQIFTIIIYKPQLQWELRKKLNGKSKTERVLHFGFSQGSILESFTQDK